MVLDAPEQLKLFDEAEKEADPTVLATGSTEVAAHTRKAKRTHEELAEDLSVEEVLHPGKRLSRRRCSPTASALRNCWHISCMRNTATPCPFTGLDFINLPIDKQILPPKG